MKLDLDFAYAQTRIQARFAALPPGAEWENLAASRALASFLEEARTGALRDWVKGFSSQSDVHDLEAGLRSLYRENLEAVVDWVPGPWREAVSWVRWLTLLPLLAHIRAGGALPGWVVRDPELQVLVSTEGTLDKGYLEDAGARCLLGSEDSLTGVWTAQWRRRWPSCSREAVHALDDFVALLMAHTEAFRQTAPESGWRLRGELRERLRLRFHQYPLQPVVPFIYLALSALDLERLRAALVSRALFSTQDEPSWIGTSGQAAV